VQYKNSEQARSANSLLDIRTQLVDADGPLVRDSGLKFTNWLGCGEASVCFVMSGSLRSKRPRRESEKSDEDIALLWQIANGRAGSRSRRYFVVNQLRYMWVLTFAHGRYERREVMAEVASFVRRLRGLNHGERFPYWYSPELHPGGHGWHVNLFIPFRIEHALIEALWGHGFVWVTDFASAMRGPKGEPLGLCRTPREGLRRAAHYGCKYAQKDWSPEHVGPANHRYEIAQGFAPRSESVWVEWPDEGEGIVAELVPVSEWNNVRRWDSNDDPEWTRPPIRTWRW
jgi:hypothetical protein